MISRIFAFLVGFGMIVAGLWSAPPAHAAAQIGPAKTFSCSDSEAAIAATGAAGVTVGSDAVYVGYRQVSAANKNPIAIKFSSGEMQWCRTDYEVTGDDNTGYGLLWDGTDAGLYAVFSATGTQGDASEDFRRFATAGWLKSYSDASTGGGGPQVAIIAQLDPATGDALRATFLTARKSDGKINSLAVTDLALEGGYLRVQADAWYSPRNPDKSAMTCAGASPFAYTLRFNLALGNVVDASAVGCVGNSVNPPGSVTVAPALGFVGTNTFTAEVQPVTAQLPLTFTWRINGSPVRVQTVNDRHDTLTYTWPSTATGQTLQVTAANSQSVALSLAPVSTTLTFAVNEAKRLYLPLVMK